MTNTTTLIIHHDLDVSPYELAERVATILREADPHLGRVQYTDLDTIIWTSRQEKAAGIVHHGPGYGSDDHHRILARAGYGRKAEAEGVATPDNPDWAGMTGAEIVAHEFGPVTTEVES